MMTAEQLKGSILQLAMQGKLVPQNPNDEPACLLKRRVLEETKEYILQGNAKRKKALPDISENEIPFEIPDSWEWMRLGSIISIKAGEGLTSHEMKEGSIPVYGGNGITGFHDKALVHKETVVIGRVGFYCGSVHVTESEAWITDNAFITTYPEKSINRDYLVYVLKYMNLGKDNNATAQPVVSGKKIYPKLFPLPPLAEQKRIVAKIEELMPFVEQYADASTKLNTLNATFPEMMKKSILREAVQGKLVPQDSRDEPASVLLGKIAKEKKRLIKEGKIKKQKPLPEITEDEIPFDIPESWEWVKLGNIIDLLSGTDFKPSEYSDISGKTVYITGASCLTDQGVISQRWTDTPRNIVSKGDLLIVCKGSGYGKTVICDVDKAHIARQIMAIKDWGLLDLNYVRFFLQSKMTYIKQSGQGVIPGIDRGTILNMVFPLPPLAEQRRIASFICNVLEAVETLGNDLE